MKRLYVVGLSSMVVFSLLFFSSCGSLQDLVTSGGRGTTTFDEESEKVPMGAGEEATGKGTTGMVTGSTLKWPTWVPDCVPRYRYGNLLMAQQMDDDGSGMLYFHDITPDGDPFMAYVKDLEREGWVEEAGWVFEMPEEEGQAIAMQKDDCFLVYNLVTEGEMSAQLTIATGTQTGQGEGGDSDSGMLDEDIIIDTDDVQATISGARIPDDYPHDFCPLYQPSDITLAMESTMDDEGYIGYTIGLYTQDSIDQVKDFYLAQDPDEINDMGAFAVFVFMSEDETDSATVSLMADVEDEDPDFETSITLSVGMKK